MGKLGPLAKSALADLCAGLKNSDPRTASGAAQAIGTMGADGAEAIPALAEAMRGTNIVLCRLAAKALSQIGSPSLSTLIAHLQHSDPFVRGESALAIGWMGPVARSAVPFLAQVVRGPRASLSRTPPPPPVSSAPKKPAEEAEWRGDSETITPAQTPVPEVATTEDSCRIHAAQALGRIGPAPPRRSTTCVKPPAPGQSNSARPRSKPSSKSNCREMPFGERRGLSPPSCYTNEDGGDKPRRSPKNMMQGLTQRSAVSPSRAVRAATSTAPRGSRRNRSTPTATPRTARTQSTSGS